MTESITGTVSEIVHGEYGDGFKLGDKTIYNYAKDYDQAPFNVGDNVTIDPWKSKKGHWYISTAEIHGRSNNARVSSQSWDEHKDASIARAVALKAAIDLMSQHKEWVEEPSSKRKGAGVITMAEQLEVYLTRKSLDERPDG